MTRTLFRRIAVGIHRETLPKKRKVVTDANVERKVFMLFKIFNVFVELDVWFSV